MLKSNLLIAFRQLVKQPLFSFIKIAGLTVGVTGCLVIFLMARQELAFEKFQPDGDRIYRIYTEFSGVYNGVNRGVPEALPGTVSTEFTGVEAVAHMHTLSANVRVEQNGSEKKFDGEKNVLLAGPEFFEVFTFHTWLAGSPKELEQPFTVVLTEAQAKKYFALDDALQAMGKPLTYRDSLKLTVAGILADVQEITDIHFTDIISNATWQKSWLKDDFNLITDWGSVNSGTQCFIKLSRNTPIEKIESQMKLLEKKSSEAEEEPDPNWRTQYKLQPLSNLHYNTDLGTFDKGREPANVSTIRMLALAAFLLLVIAAINFINLETAQAVRRSKEVGVRKTMGGTQAGLIKSFLLESGITATVSVLLALPLSELSILAFKEFLPPGISLSLTDPLTLAFLFSIIFLVTIISGLYPAFILASYRPAAALKNQVASGRNTGSALLRKVLTVFQFSFSQALIVCALIISWQIKFMVEKDMGFDQEAIVALSTPWWTTDNRPEVLLNELIQLNEVESITRNDSPPARDGWTTSTLTLLDKDEEKALSVHQRAGDTSYLQVYDIPLLAGRMVQPSDSAREYVVNEAYCREVGYQPLDLIGQQIKGDGGKRNYTIVGVMKDFHFQSLQNKIEPLSYRYRSEANSFGIKLNTSGTSLTESVEQVKKAWAKVYPDAPFEYVFLNDTVRKFYEQEKRTAKLATTATVLTIFVSCLGLLGLAAFTANQRTKEIGVRKVLGATVASIVVLLTREFVGLVMLAFAIAAPLAWYAGSQWLNNYAYSISVGWEIFALAGFLSVAVAFFTIGFQTLTAASANPVESLRYE